MARRKTDTDYGPEIVYEKPREHVADLVRLAALRDKHYARNEPVDRHRPSTAVSKGPGS